MAAGRHYAKIGRAEGRICSPVNHRSTFLNLVPTDRPLLEIGPWYSPAFSKQTHQLWYLDAFSSDHMRQTAAQYPQADPQNVPEIDFVWRGEPYAKLINITFDVAFSSHNIEHQPCLVGHLADVASILNPGGRLFLAIPDKRFCFDHFLEESSVFDVLDAYAAKRKRHTLTSLLRQLFLTTHNESPRHWRGDHGEPGVRVEGRDRIQLLKSTTNEVMTGTAYIDSHAWQFTPDSFRTIIKTVSEMGVCPLRIERIYSTLRDSNEFYAVLRRPSIWSP